ncbi:MAG: hypothetical protein ACI3YD_08230 [Alloprevotella sp.]
MRQAFLLLLLCLPASSCHTDSRHEADTQDTPPDTLAPYYYNLRAQGHFEAYVNAMHSCDSTTPAYKQQMIRLLRHHQLEVNQTKQGVNRVELLRTEMHNHNRLAHAFLKVTYNDSTHEEVMFPMVFDGEHWRIQ